ncbi:hypothetical protein [Promicromonospora soli]
MTRWRQQGRPDVEGFITECLLPGKARIVFTGLPAHVKLEFHGDATDFVTTYAYDAIYQQTSVTNADGDVVSYAYDEVGNLVKTVDPKKNATADPADYTAKMEYDLNHRPTAGVGAAGNRSTTAHNADGLVVSSTDADGNTSYVTYDERGAQVETKSPHESVGGVVQYRTTKVEYDEVGNTTRVITPRGVATADPDDFASRTEYDALNRPVRSYPPYDPADARYNDGGAFTETTYDAAGRVVMPSMPPSEGQREGGRTPALESFLDALTEVPENMEARRESHVLPEDVSPLALVALGLHSATYNE